MSLKKAMSCISGSTYERIIWLLIGSLLGACGGGTEQVAGDDPADLPVGITLPDGFSATVFADDLGAVRHLAVRDNGDVFAITRISTQPADPESAPGGLIALRDTDGDGAANEIENFGRGDTHTGIAIYNNHVYYSTANSIYAIALDNGLAPWGPSELVVEGFGDSGLGHSGKPITFDNAGHMYLQAGAPSNACQENLRTAGSPGLTPCPQLEEFGGVWRFVADSRNQIHLEDGIRFSTGHRNAVALEWNPVSAELFLVMHGRDSLDALFPEHFTAEQRQELPAEEFHVLSQGDNLGWPYTYWDPLQEARMVAPEYGGDGETLAEAGLYKDPLIGFPAHWAPNDLLFYTADQFPEQYAGGAFIAFHGSWNREPAVQRGYVVAFVPMEDGRPAGEWEIFAEGFEGPSPITSPASAAHRPSGLAQGPDGALYIGDDAGGRIWRVTWTGAATTE